MMTITDQPGLSDSVLTIFDYLSNEPASSRRTRDQIVQKFKLDQTPATVDQALMQLKQRNLIVEQNGSYMLRPEGKKLAEARAQVSKAQKSLNPVDTSPANSKLESKAVSAASAPVSLASTQTPSVVNKIRIIVEDADIERTMRHALSDLPGLDTHPLRNRDAPPKPTIVTAHTPAQRSKFARYNEIHFMLGFVDRRDTPPVPILDGDLLGRDPQSHIYLRHDNAISHRHCEFQVKADKNGVMQLWVKDLGSLNGTQIDRVPIEKGKFVRLPARAHLRIGNTTLTVIQINWESASAARAMETG